MTPDAVSIRRRGPSRRARLAVATITAAVSALAASSIPGHAGAAVSFSATYVDSGLAGGEPFVIYSHAGHDFIYSSHEGTTHLDKTYLGTPANACDLNGAGYACSYSNTVNVWYSPTGAGGTWTKAPINPADTGFSDPSLTEDAAGPNQTPNVYDTGINLVNDALFASNDGGKTWIAGTPQCMEGDRPWLAGGQNGEVFLATDTSHGAGHAIYHGTVGQVNGSNASLVCDPNGITDPNGTGVGQLYFDRTGNAVPHDTGDLIEGASFSDGGWGIGVLPDASAAWGGPSGSPTASPAGAFIDREPSYPVSGGTKTICQLYPEDCTTLAAIAPEVAVDAANNIYVVWDTNPRSADPSNMNGCTGPSSAGAPAVLPNSVVMVYTPDEGKTWSRPLTIADAHTSGGNTVLWPWITAGAGGNISVVWYQSTQLTDPDCDSASLAPNNKPPTPWTLQEATILHATDPTTVYPPVSVNAMPAVVCCDQNGKPVTHPGGVLHTGGVCESGTACVATGQDRRLGDYFTNALDQNGCVIIATGDTQMLDPTTASQMATSRPVFMQQVSGPSLTTGQDCATALAASTPEVPWSPLLVLGGTVAGLTVVRWRRRSSAV